jgi:hypothetical protein
MSDKRRPMHYKEGGELQIWDYFGVLNGTQSNILKYLTRIGLKEGESIADDKAKIIAYAENHLKCKLGFEPQSLTEQQITYLQASIVRNIERFSSSAYAYAFCYSVLCQNYDVLIELINDSEKFDNFVNSPINEY